MNARAEMPNWTLMVWMLDAYAEKCTGQQRRDEAIEQAAALRAWLAAQPVAPEGGGAELIAQQARTIETLGEIIASQSGTVAACYEGAVRENARIASTDGSDHPPRSERNYVTADELMADIEAERPGFAAECAALREQWAAEAATPPAPAREAVACRCGVNAGCSQKCDRESCVWRLAVNEARALPPSTRRQTLDWVIDRASDLNARRQEAHPAALPSGGAESERPEGAVVVDASGWPIPSGVYYSLESDNFYNAAGAGMGSDFYYLWRKRAREFPDSALTAAMGGAG